MEIQYHNSLKSTHTYLKDYIQENGYKNPITIVTKKQTNGIGSRDNKWQGCDGNLFFSFALDNKLLPNDLPLQSTSIYFSYLLKEILSLYGSKVFLKWPNDFYVENKKIGGTITTMKNGIFYCGIGLNLIKVDENFGVLDIKIDIKKLLNEYFNMLERFPSWKQIISKYEVEFYNNNDFIATGNILLKNSKLQSDGSLLVNGQKVFSLR